MASPTAFTGARLTALFKRSRSAAWGLSRARFEASLRESAAQAFKDREPDQEQLSRYLDALHVEDLALAVACADGLAPAWDHFLATHRASLLRAADAIDPRGGARELADSLFADLFGLAERDGARQSLLRYFHGRSRLGTWLRAVLAQRFVDRLRASRRTEPLADDDSPAAPVAPARTVDPRRTRYVEVLGVALTAAVAALPPRDRLRLTCYHADGQTLAAIGRMLKEHEATVSRHLTRTRREIREAVEARLAQDFGLDRAAIVECFQSVTEDAGTIDLREVLAVAPDPALRKNPVPDRSST
jgi:RNA polymerase sigma-70 factor (ECF subfamily)